MSRAIRAAVAGAFRRVAVPLGCYYTIALGLPLANGAVRGGAAFVEHALTVLLVPPAMILIACAAREVAGACGMTSVAARGRPRT